MLVIPFQRNVIGRGWFVLMYFEVFGINSVWSSEPDFTCRTSDGVLLFYRDGIRILDEISWGKNVVMNRIQCNSGLSSVTCLGVFTAPFSWLFVDLMTANALGFFY